MTGRHTVRIVVSGQVQGVGFRAWTQHHARLRGLDGWVRNRRDGTVEALLSGPADAVEEMLTRCRRGPRSARIDDLAETDAVWPDESAPGFSVRETE